MDSFTLLFANVLNPMELARVLQGAGFDAQVQSTDAVGVCDGNAHIWLDIVGREELSEADCEDEDHWPITRDSIGSMMTISVRRNFESNDLAVKVADELVTRFAAAIVWDGMDYWETLYKAYVAKK